MAKYLLDTNIVLGVLKEHAKVQAFFKSNVLNNPTRFISEITRMELLAHPHITSDEETAIHAFLVYIETLPINRVVTNRVVQLRRSKPNIKLPDAIIIATALEYHLTLATCDENLTGLIEGLEILNPNHLR
ncbi:MAG: type II toxin-antitoxin system VapC family toxin [Thiotrichaceae bacterium]|nr:type II toxin-antitoxin system VapC family toxin [Thiotrichaceae bacterium]